MLKSILEQVAALLDPGPEHMADDSHALDDEEDEEEW